MGLPYDSKPCIPLLSMGLPPPSNPYIPARFSCEDYCCGILELLGAAFGGANELGLFRLGFYDEGT